MGKDAAPGPGIYSATYSGIPVYEFQFGGDLKEHVMRRRHDDWINATHILKAAGFDKPARTRILERDVQKDVHEKIQGGYGKYQGTWIPLEAGESLAKRHSIYDRLQLIFQFVPGNESPPPAPRHASKPKAPKGQKAAQAAAAAAAIQKPPLPRWNHTQPPPQEEHIVDNGGDAFIDHDDTPDNLTVASASYMAEDDRFDMSQVSTGHRKRKREEQMQDLTEQQHALYGDELLDYFLLSRNEQPSVKPDPPPNFQPNWSIDAESHTALHWASAMGDVDVIKQQKRFHVDIMAKNLRGETPLMRAVNFTNCDDKQSFPAVLKELFDSVEARDNGGSTVIHHAAVMKNGRIFSPSSSRYYLDNILNKLQETLDSTAFQQILDAQDNDGNTALHLAAMRNARKCIRALLGRGASSDIANFEGTRAEDLILELNANKKERVPQRSSSPFAPESQRHPAFKNALGDPKPKKSQVLYQSAAATTVQSRISPIILEKFQDLAKSYDEEWQEKDVAESEAQRILSNTRVELTSMQRQIEELEAQLESDEVTRRVRDESTRAFHQVESLIAHQNSIQVHEAIEVELNRMNGDSSQDSSYEEKLNLSRQLVQLLAERKQAEKEYVEALSMVGVGDKIEKYRKLLKRCLDPKDEESLDTNLDHLIELMEETGEMDGVETNASNRQGGMAMELTTGAM